MKQITKNTLIQRYRRHRGSATLEMAFVAPFLILILVLLLYSGFAMVHIIKTKSVVAYEVRRSIYDAQGPGGDYVDSDSEQLNEAFFDSEAEFVDIRRSNNNFPEDAIEEQTVHTQNFSNDAYQLHRSWYALDESYDRVPFGRNIRIAVSMDPNLAYTEDFKKTVERDFHRIHQDWRYTYDENASADDWDGLDTVIGNHNTEEDWESTLYLTRSGMMVHHARAVRDVFLDEFDNHFESLHDQNNREYGASDNYQPETNTWAGTIRALYLIQPRYVGPIVYRTAQ